MVGIFLLVYNIARSRYISKEGVSISKLLALSYGIVSLLSEV